MEPFDLVVGGINARIMKIKAMLGLCPNVNRINESLLIVVINNPKLMVALISCISCPVIHKHKAKK